MKDAQEWRDWLALTLQQPGDGHPGLRWQPLLPFGRRQLYCLRDVDRLPELAYLLRSRGRRWLARSAWHIVRLGLSWPRGEAMMTAAESDVLRQVLPTASGASPALIQFGSPGPFQKVVVVSTSAAGRVWVSKIAFQPGADDLLAREASWLTRLGRVAELRGSVPELVLAGRLTTGRRFLTMPAASPLASPSGLGPAHRQFLEQLCRVSVRECSWEETPLRQRLHERFRHLTCELAPSVLAGPLACWERIDSELRGKVVPTCIGHGDFAPWNINGGAHGVTVFDWEYAEDSVTPLHDFFHFQCMQRVLVSRCKLRGQWLESLLEAARLHLRFVLPTSALPAGQIESMFALYLLDTLSLYIEASGEVDAEHRVIREYVRCLSALHPRRSIRVGGCQQPRGEIPHALVHRR